MTLATPAPGTRAHAAHATADVVDVVRDAVAAATPLRIVGGGSWLDAGHPVEASVSLDVSGLRGIVEYNPGDLTLTAGAGTRLSEIAAAVRANGQWLPLDAFGGPAATLGATIATASSGPLAGTIGLPRDVVLGVEVVTGAGDVVRGGGRVVKNVAGFDLTRLMTGAWGTLGVITELTVRLRAAPQVDETIVLALPRDPDHLAPLLRTVRGGAILPVAAELLNAPLARILGLGDAEVLAVRLAGNEESVRYQRGVVHSLGDATSAPPELWVEVRTIEASTASVIRLSGLPSRLATTWLTVGEAARRAGASLVHASVERGVVRAILAAGDAQAVGAVLQALGDAPNVVCERLPAALWRERGATGTHARLLDGVRRAFDPHLLLNRGILGETGA